MKTIEIIAMIWALIMSFYAIIANIKGTNALGTLFIKFVSLITVVWFSYKLILLIP